MITHRPYTPEDYPAISTWWEAHQFPSVPEFALPETAIVSLHHGTPCAAAWLYLDTSSPMAMIEWIVTNPANPPRLSALSITECVTALRTLAISQGKSVILTSCRQHSLVKLLTRHGFEVTDPNVTHLISIT